MMRITLFMSVDFHSHIHQHCSQEKSVRKQAEKLTEFMFFCRRRKKSFIIDVNDRAALD